MAIPGGFRVYQMFRVRAAATPVRPGAFMNLAIYKPCEVTPCDMLIYIHFHLPPSQIIAGYFADDCFRMKNNLSNPIKENHIFEVILATMKNGFLIVVNGEVIKKDYPYNFALEEDFYLYVSDDYPVVEIDFKNGTDWF